MNFYEKVYKIVKEIPKGNVATYGQIAKLAESPNASRAVGYALHNNPSQEEIPCHRVVNREGRLAPNFAFGGSEAQKVLLESEGVKVKNGYIDIGKYKWKKEVSK